MSRVRCEICQRDFKNQEALDMHNQAKHASSKSKERKSISTKKVRGWFIFIVVIGIVIALIWWTTASAVKNSNSCKTLPATEINIGGHKNLKLHIHQQLQIIIDDKPQLIPSNIGVSTGILRPLHTHDASGELHVEGPCKRDFILGDFFAIWGQTFNNQCIFDKCTDKGTLTFTVNGANSNEFENLILKAGDDIVIEYKSLGN